MPASAALKLIWAITIDAEGALWLGELDKGLFRLKDGTLTAVSETTPAIRGKVVTAAITDREGHVWVGFEDGTVAVYRDHVFHVYSERDGLAGGSVGALFDDQAGAIWVSAAKGVSRLAGDRFVSATAKNGLPQESVGAVMEDGRGDLWFGLRSGIVRLQRSEFEKAVADPSVPSLVQALRSVGWTSRPADVGPRRSQRHARGRWRAVVRHERRTRGHGSRARPNLNVLSRRSSSRALSSMERPSIR